MMGPFPTGFVGKNLLHFKILRLLPKSPHNPWQVLGQPVASPAPFR
jgi:hypothetical protein